MLQGVFESTSVFTVTVIDNEPMTPHSDKYYTNKSSIPAMKNVLVLTMPNTRNYTVDTDLGNNVMVRLPAGLRPCLSMYSEVSYSSYSRYCVLLLTRAQ